MTETHQQQSNAERARAAFRDRVVPVIDALAEAVESRSREPVPTGPRIRISICAIAARAAVHRTTFRAPYHRDLLERIRQLQQKACDPKAAQKMRLGIISSSCGEAAKATQPRSRFNELLRRDNERAIEMRLVEQDRLMLLQENARLKREIDRLRKIHSDRRTLSSQGGRLRR